ncbi:MAG: transcription-repair coupling factor [Defluviitaleaceae bacterium]|nr:transcription-repair coupling factor [Defluviitaleaceae bacterium]
MKLLSPLYTSPTYAQLRDFVQRGHTAWCAGTIGAQKWHLAAGLLADTQRPALVIAPNELKAKEIFADLSYFFRDACCYYPSRDMIFYAADVRSVDITRQRLQVVERLLEDGVAGAGGEGSRRVNAEDNAHGGSQATLRTHSIPQDALTETSPPAPATPRATGRQPIIILSAEALLDRLVPAAIFATYRQALAVGDRVKPDDLARKLVAMGYERCGLVEGAGQFALRGGIMDIFPAVATYIPATGEKQTLHLNPSQSLRIEFFDDEIDSIRVVDALSQRSTEKAESFLAYPMRELVFGPKRLSRARNRVKEAFAEQSAALKAAGNHKEAQTLAETLEMTLLRWGDEVATGTEAFFPFFYEEEANLLDYLPPDTVLFFDEPNATSIHMENVQTEYTDSITHRLMAGRMVPEQAQVTLPWAQVLTRSASFARVLLSSMSGKLDEFPHAPEIPFRVRSATPLRAKPSELAEDLRTLLAKYQRVVILAGTGRHGQQLTEALRDLEIPTHYAGNLDETRNEPANPAIQPQSKKEWVDAHAMETNQAIQPQSDDESSEGQAINNNQPTQLQSYNEAIEGHAINNNKATQIKIEKNGVEGLVPRGVWGDAPRSSSFDLKSFDLPAGLVTIARGALSGGFEYPDISLAVITDKDLATQQQTRRRTRRKLKNAEKINHFGDLRVGDHIVHDNHGIGVFRGIEQVVNDGLARDYLKLEYADGGNLYVQTSQMDLVHKYIGGKEDAKLNKLGGADWTKAKARARAAVEIMAQDLINLYAKRQASSGHTYGTDTVWQAEFEGQFPYSETDDQLTAIEDVKRDMESPRVMDRLLCGDVGYGKTEIAIRAAFKAVQDGKQVAYLVPTTILAQQHYDTFTSRMKDYPVTVERLSRFQTKSEQKNALKNITAGKADIVIGTHRLLSKDVQFKDLGLIIVDEEQRFGVGHKEKLKEMRADVDVLTLTATPIPRTLHFSLTGIRDMSILDEPPEERQPIQTYVMESNNEFVRDAISRELARGGQVYYLHNRVRNIAEEATRVAALVPQARVAFAHGQMSEHELENIMQDFIAGDVDVLVCTTIVETGLDIPNVNTIIIQNADFMGLSQLYQLRGRVGRSSRLAYAYLMYRRDKILREEAEKRLQTIREFTEFGAGFKIAMRDLEIRGAGNLLGQQQHGHMDAIGYDMYCKLLSDAVSGLKGEAVPEAFETAIEINVDAYIPDRFIPDEQQKLEIYKKVATINNQQDFFDIQEEIEDRFGNLPRSVSNLLEVAHMKAIARSIGVTAITQKGQNIVIVFRADAAVNVERLTTLVRKNPSRLLFTMAQSPYLTLKAHKDEKPPEDGGLGRVKTIQALLERLR